MLGQIFKRLQFETSTCRKGFVIETPESPHPEPRNCYTWSHIQSTVAASLLSTDLIGRSKFLVNKGTPLGRQNVKAESEGAKRTSLGRNVCGGFLGAARGRTEDDFGVRCGQVRVEGVSKFQWLEAHSGSGLVGN